MVKTFKYARVLSAVCRTFPALAIAVTLWACQTYDRAKATYHLAYQKAQVFGKTPRKGIILHLHGCDGLYVGADNWQSGWIDFFVRDGFLVVAPDSFADHRPPSSCPDPFSTHYSSGVYKPEVFWARIEQTKIALTALHKKYGSKPIIVWGHSEGGRIANLIDHKVAGIITTGYQCGAGITGTTSINPKVPVLIIQGSNDPNISGLRSPHICRTTFLSHSAEWNQVVVEGMGHAAPLSDPNVRSAVSQFLKRTAP